MSAKVPFESREKIPFKTETRQILNILIHSLYSEREVFIRELISNASDALTRMQFELLTNRDVLDADAEAGIWVSGDPQAKTLTIRDNGIGMDAQEMAENLGTIAHSGARAFIEAAAEQPGAISDIIGQFGVGFYSAFMAAESIEVVSRSYHPGGTAARWVAQDEETFSIQPAEKADRGTIIVIHLKEDAQEFAQEDRLREIIRKHSDFIPHPIFLGSSTEPVNQQSAIWRKQPSTLKNEDYTNFYRQFTLDHQEPLLKLHLTVDAPVQMYALLYVPQSPERSIFSPRKDEGVKLYARKVLIQEYSKDLLPAYLRFVDGVVDSEDLPLNVARESVQSNRVMAQLKRVITNKLVDALNTLGKEQPEKYAQFWKVYSRYIKEGIATDPEALVPLTPLLRFQTAKNPTGWTSLEEYTSASPSHQDKIYYLLGDNERLLASSPHLEGFKAQGTDVLLMADPLDSFVLLKLEQFDGKQLVNAAQADAPVQTVDQPEPEPETSLGEEQRSQMLERIRSVLGDRIADVRATDRLVESPARLVDADGAMKPEIQRVYRLLNQEMDAPKKVLEVNLRHPLIQRLALTAAENTVTPLVIEQLYENALLLEGSVTDPAKMIARIQDLMTAALENSHDQ
ncbi:MAG TPA: molecular chaperone HtpG [Anaerolineaceae bacterium]|nr:MAG: molecular chaperone HtpG [Chloroflexi bacterium GWB2_54_36]HAL17433.1 molecular chaperone HtpG [Anaerolineaceae bacterium]